MDILKNTNRRKYKAKKFSFQAIAKKCGALGATVATGRIIFGAVGDESRLEYTVIGDAVNLAAKLEKHTKSEGVRALCPAETFETAARQGYRPRLDVAPARSSRIEGVAHPVEIVILAP